MKQLNIFCEGQTEQGFCSQVLQPHLFSQGDGIIHTLAVGVKSHSHIYGIGRATKYDRIRRFICNTIRQKEGKNVHFTTFFDLYALPDDFPGKDINVLNSVDPTSYVLNLEQAFREDINYHKFIPYLQLYEYETILFADPAAFVCAFENCDTEIQQLSDIAAQFAGIELINDNKDTAPSKRIISVFPEYAGRKATAGPDIVEYIGLPVIRQKCPHFDQWLTLLEQIHWEVE